MQEQDKLQQNELEVELNSLGSQSIQKIELFWENLTINAISMIKPPKDKKQNPSQVDDPEKGKLQGVQEVNQNSSKKIVKSKTLINQVKGILSPGTFTAIMGPSGSGKTTMMNFLAGRINSSNLQIYGDLKVNNKSVESVYNYSNLIAYVQQDDILMATLTPREAFQFAADIRLNLSTEEKKQKVDGLINDLKLTKCQNTYIGNALIRGISGGERKRTSIGVELLSNPSLIFLDEPTTGLDSSTSLIIINILKKLAQSGRTVVSVIHQPSSEMFRQFDKLILLAQGNIIYQGDAQQVIPFFAQNGFNCPQYTNPADYVMKLMNPEGMLIELINKGQQIGNLEDQTKIMEEEFGKRLQIFVESYKKSQNYESIKPLQLNEIKIDLSQNKTSQLNQFLLLTKRGFVSELKNPMDIRAKVIQNIFFAAILSIVFNNLGSGETYIQNINGLMFFWITMFCFGSIIGNVHTFSEERPLYIRERLNQSYDVLPYYLSKNLVQLPFDILIPLIPTIIVYFAVGLNNVGTYKLGLFILINFLTYFLGASYGLTISVMISKLEVALALIPVLILPFMIFSGFFVSLNRIPYFWYPIAYISFFKYGFQALTLNQYIDIQPKVQCQLECDPIKIMDYQQDLGTNIYILFIMGMSLRILAFFALRKISKHNIVKINKLLH